MESLDSIVEEGTSVGLLEEEHVENIWLELQQADAQRKQQQHRHAASSLKRGKLTHDLIDPIASRQWKVVLSWVAFHPDQLSTYTDRSGQTALHHAVLFRAPAIIVEAMLYSSSPELASYANEEGELALHWAVRLAAPNEIMQLLVRAYPHGGCQPDSTSGQTPLSLLWDRHEETLTLDTYITPEDLEGSNAWRRLMLVATKASSSGSSNSGRRDNYALHSLVACPCPPAMLRFALKVYDISKCDSLGRLPLSIAAAAATNVTSQNIQILLETCPWGASMTDFQGRLALHWAAVTSKSWEIIKLLLNAEPRAICTRDPVTHMYPFQLLSVDRKTDNDDELGNLNAIYQMLLACPECVQPLI